MPIEILGRDNSHVRLGIRYGELYESPALWLALDNIQREGVRYGYHYGGFVIEFRPTGDYFQEYVDYEGYRGGGRGVFIPVMTRETARRENETLVIGWVNLLETVDIKELLPLLGGLFSSDQIGEMTRCLRAVNHTRAIDGESQQEIRNLFSQYGRLPTLDPPEDAGDPQEDLLAIPEERRRPAMQRTVSPFADLNPIDSGAYPIVDIPTPWPDPQSS
jgi:hypothetical protein